MGSLCLDCGLCCDGTTYSHVVLQDADGKEHFSQLGLESGPSETFFNQPCSAHQSNRCSIYDSRPTICREYRCALLRACDAGQTKEEDARLLINDTIKLRNRVRAHVKGFVKIDGPISLPRLFQLMTEKLSKMDAEERKLVDAQMLLDVGTLRVALAKRFEPKDTKLAKSTESPGSWQKGA